jgi:hypothetical protein
MEERHLWATVSSSTNNGDLLLEVNIPASQLLTKLAPARPFLLCNTLAISSHNISQLQ